MYSRNDIKDAIINGKLKIHPFDERNLTGIGYNISTTHFALSIRNGVLLNVCKRTGEEGFTYYVDIPANDTTLFFSREYIETDDTIAGTFHSKVSRVCQGLSHISTTLDPTWKGQLIIAVNNPMGRPVRMELSTNGNILTMLIHELDSKVTGENIHNNNKGRCDLLRTHFMKDFIAEEKVDRYTKIIQNLQLLKTRLENHMLFISENRYTIGTEGKYKILRNDSEKELISNCVIARLEQIKVEDLGQEYTREEVEYQSDKILKEIKRYLFIIDYELEEINHSRRIEWQDTVIEERKYTSYISVLSRYLTMRQFKNYIFLSILTGVVLLIGRSVLLKICNITGVAVLDILKDNISAATVLIVSFVINGIIGVIRKVIRKFFS